MAKNQSEGRDRNAAQPPGERKGLVSNKAAQNTGKDSRNKAGPDGGRAERVGRTFKS
jgi:hypothetical protein